MLSSFGVSLVGPLSPVATSANVATDLSFFGWCAMSALVAAIAAIVISTVRSHATVERRPAGCAERPELSIIARRPVLA